MSDTLLAPIYASDTSVTVVITESGGSPVTVTVSAGERYGTSTYAGLGDPLTGFFAELDIAIASSGLLGTYIIEAGTPRLSPQQEGLGLVIRCTTDFSIDFGASSVPPEWLGMGYQESGVVSSVGGIWRSDYCRWGTWHSPRISMMRDRNPLRLLEASTQEATHPNRHLTDFGTRHLRALTWNMCPAARVLKYTAEDATYAAVANLATGDTLGAYEWVHESGQNGKRLMVCHGGMSGLSPASWELGLMYDAGQIESIRNSLQRINAGGEYYQVSLFLELVEGVGTYYDRAR